MTVLGMNFGLLTAPVNAAPALTVVSISPSAGPLAGGTVVTITGTGFVNGASVTIGGTAATNVTVVNDTSITATTPAGKAGQQDVRVTVPNGSMTLTGGFIYGIPPTVATISPVSGPLAGGTKIIITGTGFVSGATVIITARNANIAAIDVIVVSDTTITATTPVGDAGTHDIVVTNPNGQSVQTTGFTYVPSPTILSISPTSGPTAGGTAITITGTAFVSGTLITIGGVAASDVTVVDGTSITAIIPIGKAGPQDVGITTSGGSKTLIGGFTYVAYKPTVVSIYPNSGPTAGGTIVTITGTYFVSGATVMIGGAPATDVTVMSTTLLTATNPTGTAGAQNVVVGVPGGSAPLIGAFTYVAPAPKVISISPSSGLASGGTVVKITGTDFVSGALVNIGGLVMKDVSTISSTSIIATTPAGMTGPQDVMVTNPDGRFGLLVNGFINVSTVIGISSVSVGGIVNSDGVFTWSAILQSSDAKASVSIHAGTTGKTRDGLPLKTMTVTQQTKSPASSANANVDAISYDFGPNGVTFDPPVIMTIGWDPVDLAPGVSETTKVIAFYDTTVNQWKVLPNCTVDMVDHTVSVKVSHLTLFAVMILTPTPTQTPSAPVNLWLIGGIVGGLIVGLIGAIIRGLIVVR